MSQAPAPLQKLKKNSSNAMGKKGFTSILYKIRDVPRSPWTTSSSSSRYYFCYPPPPTSWMWPSCKHPRTSSFRGARDVDGAMYKRMNSVYDASSEYSFIRRSLDAEEGGGNGGHHDRSFSAVPAELGEEQLREIVVRGVRSGRLFFEPGATSSSLKTGKALQMAAAAAAEEGDETKNTVVAPLTFKESVVVTVDSEDPYRDFKNSMEEMVAAHGIRDWKGLEELLAWYLKLNGKRTHGLIVGAFVDLLVAFSTSPSSSSSCITFEESCVAFEEIGEESA